MDCFIYRNVNKIFISSRVIRKKGQTQSINTVSGQEETQSYVWCCYDGGVEACPRTQNLLLDFRFSRICQETECHVAKRTFLGHGGHFISK